MAFPVAFGLFANCLAFWLGSLAVSNAMRSFADSNAFRAIKHLTSLIRALNFTFWLFTFDVANGVLWFCARGMAFRRLADRITYCRTMRIVALPGALWMALTFTRRDGCS
jgi:predicted small integral membrane protein